MPMSDDEFQELLGAKPQSPSAPATSSQQGMPDDEFQQLLKSQPNTQGAPQTPGPDYGAMPWSDVAKSAVQAAPGSAWSQVKSVGNAVAHPMQTLSALGQLGSGAVSQLGGTAYASGDPQEKAKTEAVLDALEQHYMDTYGSMAGFKKTLATDPFSIGMDASAAIPMVGGAARAVGIGGTALDAAGSVAASALNPIAAGVYAGSKAASAGANAVGKVGAKVQSALTGAPESLLNIARDAGSADPGKSAAFNSFLTGQGNPNDIAQTGMAAVDELKQRATSRYLADKSTLDASKPLPMDAILKAQENVNAPLDFGGVSTLHSGSRPLVDNVNSQIEDVLTSPDPAARSMIGLDNLKQSISAIAQSAPAPFNGKIGQLAGSIRDTIAAHDPTYAKMMDQWGEWKDALQDYQKTLGTKDNVTDTARLGRMFRASRTDQGTSLLDQLASTESGKNLPYMLAGSALHPWLAGGIRNTEYPLALMGAAMHPTAIPAIGVAAAQMSPRIAGNAQYYLGKLGNAAGNAGDAVLPKLSSPATLGLDRVGGTDQQPQYARGGKVKKPSHEYLVNRLMALAEKAKGAEKKHTAPILNMPDDAVTAALAKAQEAI